MTLNEILVSALTQLDRGSDAQTLDVWRDKFMRFANDAALDIAGTLKPRRTDALVIIDGHITPMNLPRHCLKILVVTIGGKPSKFVQDVGGVRVDQNEGTASVTYLYAPRQLSSPSDEPELPDYAHGLIVTYVVARERAAGDVSTQRGSSVYFELYNAGKADLRPNLGEQDTYAIINRW